MKYLLFAFLFVSLTFGACNNATSGDKKPTETKTDSIPAASASYACPMHPEVKSDKPAQCNQCGMDLEKK